MSPNKTARYKWSMLTVDIRKAWDIVAVYSIEASPNALLVINSPTPRDADILNPPMGLGIGTHEASLTA